MSNNWKFKIDLKTEDFDKINEMTGIEIPLDLKEFIIKFNAASPEKDSINVNGIERVLDAVLSFNLEESEATTFISVFKSIDSKQWIPFALDPFGNYFCYSLERNNISFFDHEENRMIETEYSLDEFIERLY